MNITAIDDLLSEYTERTRDVRAINKELTRHATKTAMAVQLDTVVAGLANVELNDEELCELENLGLPEPEMESSPVSRPPSPRPARPPSNHPVAHGEHGIG